MSSDARLSALVVDDELPALEDLARLLRTCSRVTEVACATCANEALRRLTEGDFHALFLDVRIPDLNGLELADVIHRFANPPAVVFVSAYEDGAVRAFEVNALDYLMKPVTKPRLEEAVARIAASITRGAARAELTTERVEPSRPEVVAVERLHDRSTQLIPHESILFIQARGDYVRIMSDQGRFMQRGTLAEIERRWMPAGFYRVHRAYVVNMRRVVEIRPDDRGTSSLLLTDGSEIPVARRHATELVRRLRM